MPHWKYRAYDREFKVHEGVTVGDNFMSIALDLRQKGLCILEASTIDAAKYAALRQHYGLKEVLKPADESPQRLRIRWLQKLISWIFRR